MKNLSNRDVSNDEISLSKKVLNFSPISECDPSTIYFPINIQKDLFHLFEDVVVESRLKIIEVLKKTKLP